MSIIDTLAAVANTSLPQGVDWTAQAQQYPTWQASIAAYRTGAGYAYFADLAAAKNNVQPYLASVGIDGMLASKPLYDLGTQETTRQVEANKAFLEQALSAGAAFMTPIVFDGKRLREMLQGHLALLYTGYLLHQTGMIFRLGMADQEIKDHADAVTRGYRQMYYLIMTGALEPLRLVPLPTPSPTPVQAITPAATKGLGDPTLGLGATIAIVIGSLLAIAVICAAAVLAAYLVSKNVAAYLACRDLVLAGNKSATDFCEKAVKPDADVINGLMKPAKDLVNNLFFYGMLGLGVYALVTFMPMIVGQVGESKRRWKEYA